jgi:multisubunit Na+/H+ antiporter MnhC subunit
MKTLAFAAWAALNAGTAFAHTSLVPHEHPHHTSMLPDALALVLAAVVVGAGVVAFRRMRKE